MIVLPKQLQDERLGFVKLRRKTKAPFEDEWQNKPYSYLEIQEWIDQNNNFGVQGGYGRLVILDADTPEIIAIADAHFPKTFTVKTRKGKHYYFYCDGIDKKIILKKNTAVKIDDHFGEIIAKGSQVVGPGSIHPDTGMAYEIVEDVEVATIRREDLLGALTEYIPHEFPKKDRDVEVSDISTVDVLNKKGIETRRVGDQLVCGHPVHGSTNNNNFVVHPEKNVWHCFRCNSGGGALALIAVLEGIIQCNEAVPGALRGEKFKEALAIAKDIYGFDVATVQSSDEFECFFNDMWNAEIFVKQHGHVIRNCGHLGGWYLWNGKIWELDEKYRITQLARKTVNSLYEMAHKEEDPKKQKFFYQHIKASGNKGKIEAMVSLARSNVDTSITAEQFDSDIFMLNCQNGVLNLKNKKFLDHSPDLLLTKICRTHYDEAADCPRWKEFLDRIFLGNNEIINFMQKAVGYALTGDVSRQMFFILYGKGSNGKSTLVETIFAMLGDYAATTATATFTLKRNNEIPNDVARLKGKRFIISSELAQSRHLDEALVKKFTSEEPILARFLHHEFFEFKPTGKIFFSTNYKPTIRGTDDGIWRRIKLIPFTYEFPEDRKIEGYAEKYLFAEFPGILRWAVEGYYKLQSEGLKEPDTIRYATGQYKTSEDTVGQFLDEFCVILPQAKTLVLGLYELYKNHTDHFMKRKDFNDYLERRGFTSGRATAGPHKGQFFWSGIGIREQKQSDDDEGRDKRPF